MAEFQTLYYNPMDREYHQAASETPEAAKLEDPIFPIYQLGETVPEHDPTGRFKNVIQTTQAAIRGGAGTIQLVMQTPPESAIGGRPKAYGKEVREALREVALANKVNIGGVEMPTSMNNMAGFDYQHMVFSDEKRETNLREVKDAIHFVADVAGGGGIDIVSWEFPRGVNEAGWNTGEFKQEGEQRIGYLVDERTGRTIQFRKDEILHIPFDKQRFEFIPETPGITPEEVRLQAFTWDDFKRWAEHNKQHNPNLPPEQRQPETPEELYVESQLRGQIFTSKGWYTTYMDRAEEIKRRVGQLKDAMEKAPEQQKQEIQHDINRYEEQYKDFLNSAYGNLQQSQELEERRKHLKPMHDYALNRSAMGYAEAGISAMNATQQGMAKGTVKKDVYVGPEIGWPTYYGSHPQEFVNVIKQSREKMVDMLTKPTIKKWDPTQNREIEQKNPYWDPSIDKNRAKELAKKHVKGLFDTSHMGMWLAHFEPKKDEKTGRIMETEEQRIKRFNKWYTDWVKKIANDPDNLIGGIQLVDSMSSAHGHLPPGQGIFPVKDTAKIFKDAGFTGFLVSEGHEEEKFGEGRIRTKLWQEAGGTLGPSGYFHGPPLQWRHVQHGYFGKTYSPNFIFGGYSPSNEFRLWSEVPFE